MCGARCRRRSSGGTARACPASCAATQIEPVMRVVQIADDAEVFCRAGGVGGGAGHAAQQRRGTEFDPGLVDLCVRTPRADLRRPRHDRRVGRRDRRLRAPWTVGSTTPSWTACSRSFADYADLKSPWFLGPLAGRGRAGRATRPGAPGCVGGRGRAGRARRRSSTGSARSASRRRSGTSRTAVGDRVGAGAHRALPDRARAVPAAAAGRRSATSPAMATSGWTARAIRAG